MHLVINNKVITTPISEILRGLQRELTNGKLKDIGYPKGTNIPVTCPCHKDGKERHPSCMIFTDMDDEYTQYGFAHCFTCGYAKTLPEFIADCFDEDDPEFGNEWLLARCSTAFISEVQYLPPIELEKKIVTPQYMDESVLNNYRFYHSYMWHRKLSQQVVDLFDVGYDPVKQMITFPVRDDKGKLLFVTGRSVNTKRFEIPDKVQKPIYLLYYIKQKGIKSVAVCESQINALYMWSIGIPAVGLFGTGTPYQHELLKKSGVVCFNLYFDGDDGGRKGAARFKRAMPNDIIVTEFIVPEGKDVNDLSEQEVVNLPMR